jgi:membrane protease YdiL (CAAX protease family)
MATVIGRSNRVAICFCYAASGGLGNSAMVVSNPAASQGGVRALLLASCKRAAAAFAFGSVFWILLVLVLEPSTTNHSLLLLVIANQLGFLLVYAQMEKLRIETKMIPRALLASVLLMLVAVLLGVLYDSILRILFGTATPTIGPWSEVRRLDFLPALVIVTAGVLIGPAGDESFFRAGLFGTWQAAGWSWSGALLSSGLFAVARLDLWNLPAYFGLGMLLCGAYRWTGSLLVVWVGHGLLNAAMFGFLYCGYE